jgi:hypothetical protein
MAVATNVLADRRDMPASFLKSECLERIGEEWPHCPIPPSGRRGETTMRRDSSRARQSRDVKETRPSCHIFKKWIS